MSSTGYLAETVEFQPITIKVDGVEVLTGVTISVTAAGVRPTVFVAPTTLAGKLGFMVAGMTAGIYDVHAKVASAPETPVVYVGNIRVH